MFLKNFIDCSVETIYGNFNFSSAQKVSVGMFVYVWYGMVYKFPFEML